MDLPAALLEPGRAFILRLLTAVVILTAGWLIGKVLKELVFRALLTVRFDVASQKAGIDDVFMRAEMRQSPAELVAVLVYWLVVLGSLVAAVSMLGMTQVSELLTRCLVYAPRIIAGALVLVLGLYLAIIRAEVVRAVAVNARESLQRRHASYG